MLDRLALSTTTLFYYQNINRKRPVSLSHHKQSTYRLCPTITSSFTICLTITSPFTVSVPV